MLRIDGLHTYYGHGHILQGVDLEVPPGRIAAVLGRNGVGKTTTLRSIIGLASPRSGRILLGDQDVAGWPPHLIVRVGVGYVPEGRMIFPDLTVVENIQVAQRVPAKQWSMERLFTLFPSLAERRRNKGSQLSGGEQQMLAVGRALVSSPKLLIVDEMSLGLAPVVVERLLPVLRDVASTLGTAVLVVEQHVALAMDVASRAYVLAHGRLTLEGTTEELKKNQALITASYFGDPDAAAQVSSTGSAKGTTKPDFDGSRQGPGE
jgi:branched-chain amino acid transport system ATP-binding protein